MMSQTSLRFSDISGHLYEAEILAAANQYRLVAGDGLGRFNPDGQLTREQAVSMLIEGLKEHLGAEVVVPSTVSVAPFPDVPTNRWSAAKIAWAKTAGLVVGDERGRFNPTAPVSRAALMAMMSQALTYEVRSTYGPGSTLSQVFPIDPNRLQLSDLQGHWAKGPIQQLESQGIASPYQEVGTAFRPNNPASRAFAAAAMVRWMQLPLPEQGQVEPPITCLPRSAVLNQSFATIEGHFGHHLAETTYQRGEETWTERTYSIAGLRQRLPQLPPQVELRFIFVDGRAQWILLNPSAESSMPDPSNGGWQGFNYGQAEATAFFEYIFGYRPSHYTPVPGFYGGGHEGFFEYAICLGDGIQTTFMEFIGGIANIQLSYNAACESL